MTTYSSSLLFSLLVLTGCPDPLKVPTDDGGVDTANCQDRIFLELDWASLPPSALTVTSFGSHTPSSAATYPRATDPTRIEVPITDGSGRTDVLTVQVVEATSGGPSSHTLTFPVGDDCSVHTIHGSDLPAKTVLTPKTAAKAKVDLVFMVDDSLSMKPKQDELRARFPELVQVLDSLSQQGSSADYHIGVITSDLGSGPTVVSISCQPGGKGGRFQAIGAGAPVGCMAPVGAAFIQYNQLVKDTKGLPTSNLPGDKTTSDLSTTFGCMSQVGSGGCGFEHQLESTYTAIHDAELLTENQGFFRDDALLVVIFVTDEDDCSADPNSDLFSAPDSSVTYGNQNSYRCTRFGVMYNDGGTLKLMPAGDSGGPVNQPQPATTSLGAKLFEVDRYIQFFTRNKAQGGAKIDPTDVMLVALDAPTTSVETILATKGSTPYTICTPASATCLPSLQHSCIHPTISTWSGDPAVRLNAVVSSVSDHLISSICDSSYQTALHNAAVHIATRITPGCVSVGLATPSGCDVADVTADSSGAITSFVTIPACASATSQDCWELVAADACADVCGQRQRLSVRRTGSAPSGTFVRALCDPKPACP